MKLWSSLSICFVLFFSFSAFAQKLDSDAMGKASNEIPDQIKDVGIDEKLGQNIDLNLTFTNEDGQQVKLGEYFKKDRPVSLSLIYYSCPGLCSFHFNGVIDSLKQIKMNPGKDFEVLAVSFDPRDTTDTGLKKKQNYMREYSRPGTENGFHFLTADENTIHALTNQIGFRYKFNTETKEWSHNSAAILMSPSGKITRYLHGIMFEPETYRKAILEAGEGEVGTFSDQMMMFCFQYDQKSAKYSVAIFKLLQIGAFVTMSSVAAWLYLANRKKTTTNT